MENESLAQLTVDHLSDDPLKMPPPFWRSCGATFHIVSALADLVGLMRDHVPLYQSTFKSAFQFMIAHPNIDDLSDEEVNEYGVLIVDLQALQHQIRLKCDIACLMSAIQTEDLINGFCVFNLHKDIADTIEKLQPLDKLLIASAAIGSSSIKGSRVSDGIQKLSKWRNAFAHGHCVDRPTKSLRKNHLVEPQEMRGALAAFDEAITLVRAYLLVEEHLASISRNSYTMSKAHDGHQIENLLNELSGYRIAESDGYLEVSKF
jgi:hypothetical protein